MRGTVEPGYEPLREAFAAVAGEGAQLAVRVAGRQVADLWTGEDVTADSLTGVFSSTKGATFLVLALLAQEGSVRLDREVAAYWPEFAAEGKGAVTVRDLAGHRAGAIGTAEGFTPAEVADDAALAARLAPHRPYWRPGATFGYHALTVGALVGEVVRRATGATLKQVYDERVRRPYGVDVHLGLPEAEEPRVLPVLPPAPEAQDRDAVPEAPDSIAGIAGNLHHREPTVLAALPNAREVRAGGQASVAGVGSARGLARLYAAAVTGVDGRPPLLSAATAAECARPFSAGHDLVLGVRRAYGLGFMTARPFLGADAFGHDGAGGSMAFADPARGLAFGFVPRRFPSPGGAGPGTERLAVLARDCARRAG
ncbi:serine hydrolase domain-containing protein [Streptomyces marincola]|uniref:EstA family serine hydrolase n=1 Tax=Streptomyces marincola TaxID=2878388 RepID=A0A1W7D6J7_9ACTN|nr:serine hydrolase domain-containing protein [Streptomyces marincola]ARQ72592.1 EstA family serine hydrolase [Streptomyces marincola]